MFDLDGRVAIVTGAGQSVGRGIAAALASAGAVVAVNDLHAERAEAVAEEITAGGDRAVAAPFDVTRLDEVRGGVSKVQQRFGRIDILVNNAGRVDDGRTRLGRFRDSDPALWHLWIDLNLYGSLYMIRSVLPGMVNRRFGRVIQISSGSGSRGIPSGVALYGAGKAAIEGAMRHIAIEEAQSGVTFNAIALGLMANTATKWEKASPGEVQPGTLAAVPIGRLGEPREVGACAVWLASDLAGDRK